MADFKKDNSTRQPFGVNVWRRSVRDVKHNSYTVSPLGVPEETIDGSIQKVLQPGTIMAKITSGPANGKVGVFQAGGTDEIQVLTGTGTISGGTFTVTMLGAITAAIAWNAVAATVQAAIRLAVANLTGTDATTVANKAIADSLTVTGGPIASAPFVITYNGETGADVAQATIGNSLTGSSPVITPTTSTPGVAGATDGRENTANIVGINDTFLPYQLLDRDVECAIAYEAAAVEEWCFEYNSAGARVALTTTTRDAIVARPNLAILFPD